MKTQTKLPEGWETIELNEGLALIRNGLVYKKTTNTEGLAITRIETIAPGEIDLTRIGPVLGLNDNLIKAYSLQKGDILFSHINSEAHIGKTAMYEGCPKILIHGMNLLLLRADAQKVYPKYLLFTLKRLKDKGLFKSICKTAVNQASINQTELGKIKLVLPPLQEQRAIAEVLSTVDEAIAKVDKAIEKTERVKKGLIQSLLKNEDWKITSLADESHFDVVMGQSPPSSSYTKKEGMPFLQGNAEFGETYPTPTKHTNKPLKLAEVGDILISVRAPVGDINMCDKKMCIGRGLGAIRVLTGLNLFYFYYLRQIRDKIERLGQGSTFKAITRSTLKQIVVPLPPRHEQERMVEILSQLDNELSLQRSKKQKLQNIKQALMNDLLTGKKRIAEVSK